MVYLSLFLTNVIFSGFGRAVFVFSLPTYIIPQSYKIVKFLGGVFVALCNEMCVMEMWNVMGFLGFYSWVAQLGRVSYYCGNIVTYNNAYESTTCV